MKPLHELIILNHFYYCFLLAIKLRKCNLPSVDGITPNIFMKRWLSVAQKKRLFDKVVYDEIQWLLESLSDKRTTFQEFEFNIELIYHRSLDMIKEKEVLVPSASCIKANRADSSVSIAQITL